MEGRPKVLVDCGRCDFQNTYDEENIDSRELCCPSCGSLSKTRDIREILMRGKGIFNGSESIDDMLACLEQRAHTISNLRDEGWQIESAGDDYLYLIKFVD